eukprot:TRINITY_DN5551_c0_g2_i3.p3 TRINITY_DN5551_c0_g2~~TRINITY_DN5551_c0_g2_i3.p3  ORF type:complete len:116 (-),score=4.94 TRINITY_DN5551_c0_g2_i3:147-494(-)
MSRGQQLQSTFYLVILQDHNFRVVVDKKVQYKKSVFVFLNDLYYVSIRDQLRTQCKSLKSFLMCRELLNDVSKLFLSLVTQFLFVGGIVAKKAKLKKVFHQSWLMSDSCKSVKKF